MPIYEYRCAKCGSISEYLVGVGQDKVKMVCKKCGSEALDRIMSKTFVNMKGNARTHDDGKACCGRDEQCEIPPCSDSGECQR